MSGSPPTTESPRPNRNAPRRRSLRLGLALIVAVAVVLVIAAIAGDRGSIQSDERIVLFPTTAHLRGDGQFWEVPVHGWVFEPEVDDRMRSAAIAVLRKSLGLSDVAARSPLLSRRLQPFLVDNQRGKRITVEVAGVREQLGPSDEQGHFTGTLHVPVVAAKQSVDNGVLVVQAHGASHGEGPFRGSVRLVEPSGISVISDIDDTVKISDVKDPKALLRNTLIEPFRPAPGMPELYRRWAARGVVFHYVSGSPWQLVQPLTSFMAQQRLPVAALSLKSFRLKDSSLLELFADPIRTKPAAMDPIFQAYPGRRFCLIGDSGEKDPEVYGLMARRYPAQVACVYIRNVTDEDPDGPRFRDAFSTLERERWQIFTDPSDLAIPE